MPQKTNESMHGKKLQRNQLWNLISEQLRAAFNDTSNEYEHLRDMFEAAYKYDLRYSIEYIPSEDSFLVYDDSIG